MSELIQDIKVDYIDHMGSDLTVVNAARVSFDKESDWLSEKDEKLIKYLATHNHWTPFSHCQIQLRETVPIFVARQRFKHMIGQTYNEMSRRYVDDTPFFFSPVLWREKADNVKQGSSSNTIMYLNDGKLIYEDYMEHIEMCCARYEKYIASGVCAEQARMVLPQSMMTSYYVTGSLYAFARAYNLRSEGHAQKEIQDLAKHWGDIISNLYPISWKYLTGKND